MEDLRNLKKEIRNEIRLLEFKKFLWDQHKPAEYIKSLLQEELNKDTYVVEKYPSKKEKSLINLQNIAVSAGTEV